MLGSFRGALASVGADACPRPSSRLIAVRLRDAAGPLRIPFSLRSCAAVLAAMSILVSASALAQTEKPAVPDPAKPTPVEIKLTDLRSTLESTSVHIGSRVEFQIPQLADAVSQKVCDPADWRLMVNAIVLTAPKPQIDLGTGRVSFWFDRDDADREAWVKLLGAPPLDGIRKVNFKIRLDGTHELAPSGNSADIDFRMFDLWRVWAGLTLFLIAAFVFVILAQRSQIVRDDVTSDGSGRRPYSLGRCQLSFWTFLVVGSFLLIWIVTGDYNHIVTQQTFILLGISSATGLASVAIDGGKAAIANAKSEGFLLDLLTDRNGITVYRFQLMLWTMALGVVYVFSVYQTLSTPNFDANLLTLTGISAGTYLGFKIPEKQS